MSYKLKVRKSGIGWDWKIVTGDYIPLKVDDGGCFTRRGCIRQGRRHLKKLVDPDPRTIWTKV